MLWGIWAMVAFALTAGAFLLLANLSSNLSTREVTSGPRPTNSTPPLALELDESRLEELESESDQTLPLAVENAGESDFTDISLTMRVTSENTARPEARYYRATVKDLPAGESKTVRFTLDLSPPEDHERQASSPPGTLEPRIILEVQATTPEGISAIRTAVLPL